MTAELRRALVIRRPLLELTGAGWVTAELSVTSDEPAMGVRVAVLDVAKDSWTIQGEV